MLCNGIFGVSKKSVFGYRDLRFNSRLYRYVVSSMKPF